MTPSGLIGVVHLGAMPGDPRDDATFERVRDHARRDADRLVEGGVDALIVENFGSAPFWKGDGSQRIPPHQVACLSTITFDLKRSLAIPVGINCLRNDAYSALGIAAACDLDFMRVNVHTGAYVTDQGLIEGEAADTLRYRAALGTSCAIAADVLVKHATPLAPLTIETAVEECLHRSLADAVIVTGSGTGAPVDPKQLARARDAAGSGAVWLGSGLTPENAPEMLPFVHAAIVGTYLKENGQVRAPVDVDRVKRMADAVRGRFYTG